MAQPTVKKVTKKEAIPEYYLLNSQVGIPTSDGKIQVNKDKEALHAYFLQYVNPNTVFFTTLEEKIQYLLREDYLDEQVFDKYSMKQIKALYKRAHSFKYRFNSFTSAHKFYKQYALRTRDGDRFLGRFEDVMVWVSMSFANGDFQLAEQYVDLMMSRAFTPATPTLLNIGRKTGGELTSCFKAGTRITTINGTVNIENIKVGDEVLTHDGTFKKVTELKINTNSEPLVELDVVGVNGMLEGTPEHPVLALNSLTERDVPELVGKDGATGNVRWVALKDLRKGDHVVVGSTLPTGGDTPEYLSVYQVNNYSSRNYRVTDDGMLRQLSVDVKNNKKKGHDYSLRSNPVRDLIKVGYKLGFLVGAYLAEGYVGDNKVSYTLNSNDTAFIQQLFNYSKELFDVVPTVITNKDGSTNVNIHAKSISEFMVNMAGTGFDSKLLKPTFLDVAGNEVVQGLLHGVFRGDGYMTSNSLGMDLSNTELSQQLLGLLRGQGITANHREYETRSGVIAGSIRIPYSSAVQEEFIMGVGKDTHKLRGERPKNNHYHEVIGGYQLHKVRGVKRTDVEPTVYNLEVEGNHTYVANNIVVHNCYLLAFQDNLPSIRRVKADGEALSALGGGVSFNLINVRETLAPIRKRKGLASGVVPIAKILEDIGTYANQGGKEVCHRTV